MNGIKSSSLDTISGQILASNALKNNFDEAVNLYKNFIAQKRQDGGTDKEVTIAGVSSHNGSNSWKRGSGRGGGGGGGDDVEPDMTVKLRYYKKDEYAKLSNAQKLGLKRKREKQTGGGGGGSGKSGKDGEKKMTIAAMETAMEKMFIKHKSGTDADNESSDSEEESPSPKRQKITEKKKKSKKNRNNSALDRVEE